MSDARLNVFLARPSEEGARAMLLDSRRGGEPVPSLVLQWLLVLPRWDDLSPELRELVGQAVESVLPDGFRHAGLRPCKLGDQHHVIAQYVGPDGPFALVPGGRMTLGWNRKDVALTSLQRSAWTQANDDPAYIRFEQFLDVYYTPQREVTLDPLLVEVEPRPALDYIDDELERGDEDASLQTLLERAVERSGMRLPTSDEWEHACRGGSRRLFRWGDEWPRGIPHGGSTDFMGHRVPNGFGLSMVSDPYQVECIAGGMEFRGGDGGGAVCGGRPQPEPWYSFASAFSYPLKFVAEDVDEFCEAAVVRRVLSLPDDQVGSAG